MSIKQISIGDRAVGPGAPVFVIAEAGVNHNGDLDLAFKLVDAAFAAGADAVKFQSFSADDLVSATAPKANYQLDTTDPAESQYEMIKRLELSAAAHKAISAHCAQVGIKFLSTPFDRRSADLLQKLEVPAFKVSSGDLTDWPLLEHLATFGKPIILSTGMADLEEVRGSLTLIQHKGNTRVIVLHCVSNYPAAASDANLRAMQTMACEFQVPIGFSDHTEGSAVAIAAVALGACVIEKHLTLDRNLPGPDHKASLEPDEFKLLVDNIRAVESSLGNGLKRPAASESDTRNVARRSLVAAGKLEAGVVLEAAMLSEKRPGTGISPSSINRVVGRKLRRQLEPNEMIMWSDLS